MTDDISEVVDPHSGGLVRTDAHRHGIPADLLAHHHIPLRVSVASGNVLTRRAMTRLRPKLTKPLPVTFVDGGEKCFDTDAGRVTGEAEACGEVRGPLASVDGTLVTTL